MKKDHTCIGNLFTLIVLKNGFKEKKLWKNYYTKTEV